MRKHIKNKLLSIIDMMKECEKEVEKLLQLMNIEEALQLLTDLQQTAIDIGTQIELSEGNGTQTVAFLEEYCELIWQCSQSNTVQMAQEYCRKLVFVSEQIKETLESEIPIRKEVVFLPYKASMWDSLESIWKAADEDPDCDARVIPIPYYDRNADGSFGEMHYEGDKFPDYVPVLSYENYNIQYNEPDVIYIHNPYDGHNYVTSVHPAFYSNKLKEYTEMLVYVPYFICGAYKDIKAFEDKHLVACLKNIDIFVAQSKFHGELLEKMGLPREKVIALGNPKVDKIVNDLKSQKYEVPDEWKEKIKGKKVIVLNSSIGSLLSKKDYFDVLEERITTILKYEDIVLIWRPHPLLEATIKSMRVEFLDSYNKLINMDKTVGNMILDKTADTMLATFISDAMITDISSWMRQYTITGKPILMLNGRKAMRENYISVFDHFSNYFLYDGFSIDEFCQNLLAGKDENKEERNKYLKYSIDNLEGTSGINIHKCIMGKM